MLLEGWRAVHSDFSDLEVHVYTGVPRLLSKQAPWELQCVLFVVTYPRQGDWLVNGAYRYLALRFL